MNYELLLSKMEKFLKETPANYLVNEFEKLGYKFIDTNVYYTESIPPPTIDYCTSLKSDVKDKKSIFGLLKAKNNCKKHNLETFEVFFSLN